MAQLRFLPTLGSALARLFWELRRTGRIVMRGLGLAGALTLVCAVVTTLSGIIGHRGLGAISKLNGQLEAIARTPSLPLALAVDDDAMRSAAFETRLLPHEDVPVVVQSLIALAEGKHLAMPRGDYKAQPEPSAGFLRYRMTLPVKGEAVAIQEFVMQALKQHKSLVLESVQFKREAIVSPLVEARVQWVLLARLPSHAEQLGTQAPR